MAEEPDYDKVDDHTLRVKNVLEKGNSWSRVLTRLFNFSARQVTTVFSEWRTYGQAPSVSNTMQVQNFSDFESLDEIRQMREKLIELKGRPPELESMELKKPARPALGANNGN